MRGVRHKLQAADEMNEFRESGKHFGRIGAKVMKLLEGAEGLRHLAAHEGLEKINDPAPVGETQHSAQGVCGDRAGQSRAMSDRLIEKRKRVAHRAFRRAGDETKRLVLDRDSLLGA